MHFYRPPIQWKRNGGSWFTSPIQGASNYEENVRKSNRFNARI